MKQTQLTAYLPIQFGWEEGFIEKTIEMAKEIRERSEDLEFPLWQHDSLYPRIEILNSQDPTIQDELQIWVNMLPDERYKALIHPTVRAHIESRNLFDENPLFFKITGTVSYEPASIIETHNTEGKEGSISQENAEYLHTNWIREAFLRRIYDLVLVANVASLGSMGIKEGIILQDDKLHDKTDLMSANQLRYAAELVDKIGWPKLQKLDFIQVWKWAIAQKGFLEGYSKNSVTRALSAFTYLFDENIEWQGPSLFWALVGIEAIYKEGNTGITEQIREKTQNLFGEPTEFKKKLTGMYNYRSRFVHGDLDFPSRHPSDEISEAEFVWELSEHIDLAIGILAATFQELVQRNWSGFKFSYVVSNSDA